MKPTRAEFILFVGCMVLIGWVLGYTDAIIMHAREIPKPSKEYVDLGVKRITAYHAVEGQCDSTPDVGAYGQVAVNGRPTGNWFACNFLRFGTKIVIPELTVSIVWTCRDRMNRRYPNSIDLLFHTTEPSFGRQYKKVFIVEVKK